MESVVRNIIINDTPISWGQDPSRPVTERDLWELSGIHPRRLITPSNKSPKEDRDPGEVRDSKAVPSDHSQKVMSTSASPPTRAYTDQGDFTRRSFAANHLTLNHTDSEFGKPYMYQHAMGEGGVTLSSAKYPAVACSRSKRGIKVHKSIIKSQQRAAASASAMAANEAALPTEGPCSNLECLEANATRICKKCKKVFYCDTKCRRKNQKMHSAVCK